MNRFNCLIIQTHSSPHLILMLATGFVDKRMLKIRISWAQWYSDSTSTSHKLRSESRKFQGGRVAAVSGNKSSGINSLLSSKSSLNSLQRFYPLDALFSEYLIKSDSLKSEYKKKTFYFHLDTYNLKSDWRSDESTVTRKELCFSWWNIRNSVVERNFSVQQGDSKYGIQHEKDDNFIKAMNF